MKKFFVLLLGSFLSSAALADNSFTAPTAIGAAAVGQIPGTATNDNANAGNVGEYLESVVLSGSSVNLTTATTADVTSISLSVGDWDCDGTANIIGAATTITTDNIAWISNASATLPTPPNHGSYSRFTSGSGLSYTNETLGLAVGLFRISLASPGTAYLSVRSSFTVSTAAAFGALRCRRIR